jgi:hypothetical protein
MGLGAALDIVVRNNVGLSGAIVCDIVQPSHLPIVITCRIILEHQVDRFADREQNKSLKSKLTLDEKPN